MRMGRGRLLTVAAALLLLASAPAWAAIDKDGDLIATFEGGITPKVLPRAAPVPVAVHVAGNFRSASGDSDRLPQLRRIAVMINRQGELFDRGLPTCDVASIQPATQREAREICSSALIGTGHVNVQVRISGQAPFLVKARLLAFNGPRRDGRKLIFAQVYARQPPGSFILTFHLDRRGGELGTVLSTTLPPETQEWAYLTHFDMTLRRTYTHDGVRRSFVSAACAAPPGFDRVVFPFARVVYDFAEGTRLSASESGVCRVGRG